MKLHSTNLAYNFVQMNFKGMQAIRVPERPIFRALILRQKRVAKIPKYYI